MISGVFGLPRAGKSTFLAWCVDRVERGKPLEVGHLLWKTPLGECKHYDRIYCNFPMVGTYKINFDELGKYNFENCLIIIDEIMHYADSRDWKNFDSDLKYFFSMHGHYHIDFIYCSQSFRDCDLKIRQNTHAFFYMEKNGGKTKITPIKQEWDKMQMAPCYTFAPPLGCASIRRSRYYWRFDSFARRSMPAPAASPWYAVRPAAPAFGLRRLLDRFRPAPSPAPARRYVLASRSRWRSVLPAAPALPAATIGIRL